MSLTGKILLADNVTNICCGDNINLIIEIENQEKIFVKEIFLTFRGEENVKFDDLLQKSKDGKIIYIMKEFEGQHILLNKHINIQTMDVIDKGNLLYNVNLNIPHQLPQSVNRKYGAVKYEFELSVKSATGVQILFTLPIDIKEYLNAYSNKECVRPFHTVFQKSLCWGICNFEPLKVILTIPNTSIIPGYYINYFLKIENFTKYLDLQRLSVILTQTQHFKALKPKERTKQVHISLNKITHLFYGDHHNSNLEGSFELPRSLVPTSPKSYLINTSYKLHFILVFRGIHSDGYISLPITVGNNREVTAKISDCEKYETRLQIEHDPNTECEV